MEAQDKKPRVGAAKGPRGKDAKDNKGDEFNATLFWLLRALFKNLPIVIGMLVLALGASVAYTKSLPKVYEASSSIEFDPDVVRPLSQQSSADARWLASFADNREYYETQYNLIVSDRVLSSVVRDLGLASDPDFLGFRAEKPVSVEDATVILRSRVRVEPIKFSRLVWVRVEDTNPARCRRLTDAIAHAYAQQNLEKTVSATAEAVVWLSGQLDLYRRSLETNENELHEFKRKNELPSSTLEEISKMVRLEMQQYDEALTRIRTRKQELAARNSELAKVSADDPDQVPASELLTNSFLTSLRQQYQNATRERREVVAEGKGENHPQVKKVDEKVVQSRRDLLEEIKNIQGAVQRDLAILQREEAGVSGLYEAASRRAVELNLKEMEFRRLDRTRAQNEKIYGVLLEQLKQADLARMMNVNNIRVVDAATEPQVPIRPRLSTNLLVGAALGIVLGFLFVFVREQLDNTVKTPEDLELRLGVTFLGLLPVVDDKEGAPSYIGRRPRRVARKLASELVVHERPLSGIAEASRTLRTNLTFMSPDDPYRTLLVTSAVPGEGKTTVACSVGISLAQASLRVCLLDGDLRRPRLHRIFDRAGDAGLTNLLMGEATLEEVAKPTVVPNLYCVPSGPMPPNPADMLHSAKFKKLIQELGRTFDRVVIDSPPLAAVTDAAIMSASVDATIFVVRAFSTSRAVSKDGLRALADVDANVIGAVLNAVDLRKRSNNYYERYYYYRREGYATHETTEAKSPPTEQPPTSPPN